MRPPTVFWDMSVIAPSPSARTKPPNSPRSGATTGASVSSRCPTHHAGNAVVWGPVGAASVHHPAETPQKQNTILDRYRLDHGGKYSRNSCRKSTCLHISLHPSSIDRFGRNVTRKHLRPTVDICRGSLACVRAGMYMAHETMSCSVRAPKGKEHFADLQDHCMKPPVLDAAARGHSWQNKRK